MSNLNGAVSTAVPSNPTMGNFQRLPIEVREMIYQYLLDARYTRLKRHTREDPAYKFHTNILAVNRTIHAEAERYLYKVNTFVTASHTLDDGYKDGFMWTAQLWVPLVAWKSHSEDGQQSHRATTIQYNTLQVRFTYSSDRLSNDSYSIGLGLRDARQTRSCVLLAADLGSYCSVLAHFLILIEGPKFVLCEHGPPELDQTRGSDRYIRPSPSLAITLRSTPYNLMNSQSQTLLLSPFSNVVGPSLRVSVLGNVVDHVQMERVRKHMGPSLTCRDAEDWSFYEQFELHKTIADTAALAGELKLAMAMYDYLLSDVPIFSKSLPAEHRFTSTIRQACVLLAHDTLLSKAHVSSKLHRPETFTKTLNLLLRILEGYSDDPPDFLNLPGTYGCIIALVALGSESSNTLPLKCLKLRKAGRVTRKPDHMVGWVDEKHLRQTSRAFREKMNRLQKDLGLPLTRFFEFDEAMKQRRS